jgi:ribosome-binding protein aMBF1 (putative translation factor)
MTPHQATAPRRRIRWNGHRVIKPVELLSARIFRLRIARGLSIYELAQLASIDVGIIRSLEAGKPVDKRNLPAVAAALGVPLCYLICGGHDCATQACVPAGQLRRSSGILLH